MNGIGPDLDNKDLVVPMEREVTMGGVEVMLIVS